MPSSRSGGSRRRKRRPRYLGADEIQRGKGQQYWTVLSDLVHGEVIGLSRDRTQESLSGLLKQELDNRQRASVHAVCTDMHHPYVNAVAEMLPKAEVVFDKECCAQHSLSYVECPSMWRDQVGLATTGGPRLRVRHITNHPTDVRAMSGWTHWAASQGVGWA